MSSRKLGKTKYLKNIVIFLLIFAWIYSGWPQIWKNPSFPPEIQEVWAGEAIFDTAATHEWNSPPGVTSVDVECWGGGGAGGGGDTKNAPGGGGGGGGSYAKETGITITAETLYYVYVGVGGTGGPGDGAPGGDSYFDVGNDIRAKGGSGGIDQGGGGTGGAGGVLGTGTTRYLGGNGFVGAGTVGGGGGEGSGSTVKGTDATGQTGASGTDGGDGGSGGNQGTVGSSGTAPGGAGGGGGTRTGGNVTGGNGAAGKCILTWTAAAAPTLTFTISGDLAIGFSTLDVSNERWATEDESGSGSEVSAHTLTVSTNATNGYTITVNGTTLTSGGDTIDAIGDTAVDVTAGNGTEQFGIRLTASGTGTPTAPYNGASNNYALDTLAFPDEIASGAGDGTTTTFNVFYAANIAATTEAHTDYTSTLTYIATGNF